jgi:dipeptidyl aminopeptidase/acylaminoacyl peptidase
MFTLKSPWFSIASSVATIACTIGIGFTQFAGLVAAQTVSSGGTIQPNANLLVQGIPPLPQAIADSMRKYSDFRGFSLVEWHPTKREMLAAHRKGSTAQLFSIAGPGATPVQITDFAERVTSATYEPTEGRYIVFERSTGGNEADQIFRLDLDTKQTTLLTNPQERHNMGRWNKAKNKMFYSSVPLDRTATGGSRAVVNTTLRLLDPLKPETAEVVATLPGTGWFGFQYSMDEKEILAVNYKSANESEIWVIDAATGKQQKLLPEAGSTVRARHYSVGYSKDPSKIFLLSDRDGEFARLMVYDRSNKSLSPLGAANQFELSSANLSEDGSRLALTLNVDGASQLQLLDLSPSNKVLPAPQFPVATLRGELWHPRTNELAFSVNSAQGPSDLYSFNERTQKTERWTQAYAPPEVDLASFGKHSVIRWKSFDGRMISGLMIQPPEKFIGKRPVLIDIHGGPEAQSRPGFMGRLNYFINEKGVVVIEPNVRGSSGYGKTFLALDNGYQREDSVKDIGALLDWIAQQPQLDASRVMVMGGSYGGYMSLASAIFYGDRLVGAVDSVGISNFVTFLETTESYRRDLRRVEYGDERDPKMREFLNRISPLTNAAKIKIPLFVVQGKNDPRVPYTEAEQIVAAVRANNTPVWYLRAENEGHGFARKENADFYFFALAAFIERYLKP